VGVENLAMAAVATLASAWTSRSRFALPEVLLGCIAVAVWLGLIPAELVLTFVA
jgi:hypothetical protein